MVYILIITGYMFTFSNQSACDAARKAIENSDIRYTALYSDCIAIPKPEAIIGSGR